MICKYCNKEYSDTINNCPFCEFPKNGTEEMKMNYLVKREQYHATIKKAEQKILTVTVLVFIIAVLVIIQIVLSYLNPNVPNFILITNIIISVLYIMAGVFVSKKPILITTMSLILYISIIILNYLLFSESLSDGIIFKVIIISVFAIGILYSVKAVKSQKALKEKDYWKHQ